MNWLTFANPALGLCTLGIAIPIAIHLYHRHEPRRIEFPTIRFLRRTLTEQSIFRRLRHIILLLLRMAFIGLIAFAFLKPFITYSSFIGKAGDRTAAVLVLDASASMGYTYRGATPFAKAKAEAIRLLRSLKPGDRANLIVAGEVTSVSYPRLAPNMQSLKEDLHCHGVTAARADVSTALRTAAAQLARDDSPKKEVYVFSDFQRSNWSDVDLAWVEKDYRVYFVDVGLPGAANRAVTSVAVRPQSPVASEPVTLLCEVANYTREAGDVPVRLAFDTGEEMEQSVFMPAFSRAPVSFSCRMGRAGVFPGEVSIPEDGLSVDDRRFFTVDMREKVRVLIVSASDPSDRRSAAYFLSRAMQPFRNEAGKLSVRTVGTASLTRAKLRDYDVILLTDTGTLRKEALGRLLRHMKEGGSVVFFLCGKEASANLAALEALGNGAPILPFGVGELFDLSGQRNAFTYFREADLDNPMLQFFRNPERGDLSSIKVYRFHQTPPADDHSEVLLKYQDGTIAMARRNVGSGALLLCNFSPALDASNLAKNVNFVPLTHEMIRALRPQHGGDLGCIVGEPGYATLPSSRAAGEITARGPSSDAVDVAVDRVADSLSVTVKDTSRPGVYRILSDEETVAAIPVNVHPDESDLRPMDGQAVTKRSKSGEKHLVQAGQGENTLTAVRMGRPIWHFLLIASLLVISVEQALTHRWRQ